MYIFGLKNELFIKTYKFPDMTGWLDFEIYAQRKSK